MKKILILALLCALPLSANAAPPPVHKAAWYRFYWSGLHIGDMVVEITEERDAYESRAVVDSNGMARFFSQFWSDTRTVGRKNGTQYVYHPVQFDTKFHRRKGGWRKIVLDYNLDGAIIKDFYDPEENRAKRPAVPDDQRAGAFDPMTIALVARTRVQQALDGKAESTLTLPLYDGRRLAKVDFEVLGRERVDIFGKEVDAVHVRFERIPVAGYTANELERDPGEEPKVDLYLTTGSLLPFHLVGEAVLGTEVGHIQRWCDDFKTCEQKMREE